MEAFYTVTAGASVTQLGPFDKDVVVQTLAIAAGTTTYAYLNRKNESVATLQARSGFQPDVVGFAFLTSGFSVLGNIGAPLSAGSQLYLAVSAAVAVLVLYEIVSI